MLAGETLSRCWDGNPGVLTFPPVWSERGPGVSQHLQGRVGETPPWSPASSSGCAAGQADTPAADRLSPVFWLGAQGSWVQGHVIACSTYDSVHSSARRVAAACVGIAELTFIWLFWVQTAMTAP